MSESTDPDELPYGPGNSDYEYDGARQRELDEEAEREAEARLLAAKRRASGVSLEDFGDYEDFV